MSDLERYFNTGSSFDALVDSALIHYQFETIHPFLDGNGRIGRLLITIFLMQKGILSAPVLYISYFLKKNRIEYYDRLSEVRNKGNYEQWVKFFLQAVCESAKDATETTYELIELHERSTAIIKGFGRGAKTALRLLQYLEENPIIDIQKTALALGLTYKTVSNAVNRLREVGALSQMAGKQRNRTFAYRAYLEILKDGTCWEIGL
jgi:Fic family protein